MPPGKAAVSLTPRTSGGGPPLLGPPSTAALEEILAAAPRKLPAPTDDGGRTRIGTPTPTPGADEPALNVAHQSPPRSRVVLGDVTLAGSMSSPAIEKAARAQIYWTLVQRCRGPDGAILPPDSVALSFDLDEGGSLIPTRIEATAADPRHEEAAECMRRELAGLAFRVPAGARGQTTPVNATVPSVD
ncbi:hypothetical protein [Chondromyces apiculatus]|nr:hypothetical protein [Chondromyces apiculatus]